MNEVIIQFQDASGMWVSVQTIPHNSMMILNAMNDTKRQYPTLRVRAVDQQGRLIDILP